MTKKGQGLPLNTIIIAIIVLVVLVVLIAIFTGRIAIFSSDLDKAASLEGTKVRAQLIGQNCVPSDAGVKDAFDRADRNDDNSFATDELNTRDNNIQTLISDCANKKDDRTGCISVGKCQWQGS